MLALRGAAWSSCGKIPKAAPLVCSVASSGRDVLVPGSGERWISPVLRTALCTIYGRGCVSPTEATCTACLPFLARGKVKVLVVRLCLTLCDPMDCSPPGTSIHEILQVRTREGIVIRFSRESSQPSNRTQVSYIAGSFFTIGKSIHVGIATQML